jgi:MFS transporter, DHA1 family, inner membrane transport protein
MSFFTNRTVNLLNLHYAIHSVALTGGAAFFLAYLLSAGVPTVGVLLSLAAILIGRLIFRPLVVPLAVRFGLKRLVAAGTVASAMQYPLLAEVHGVGPFLFALCAVSALGDTLYWSTYHAYFAALGDHEARGAQVGAREAIAELVGIASPLATGLVLARFGPRAAFGATAVVLLTAALPILFTPEVKVARAPRGAWKAARAGALFFLADGWGAAGFYFVWQLVLFLSLGRSFVDFGGVLALAALAGAAGGLLLGRHIDAGGGVRAVWIAIGTIAAANLLRALVPAHPALALPAAALGAVAVCLYLPTMLTAVYNLAKRSPCVLRFHVAAEGGWDVGGASALGLTALLVWLGAPLWSGSLLALIGAAAEFVLLRRYYRDHAEPMSRCSTRPRADT